jgi:hypothetical protein
MLVIKIPNINNLKEFPFEMFDEGILYDENPENIIK